MPNLGAGAKTLRKPEPEHVVSAPQDCIFAQPNLAGISITHANKPTNPLFKLKMDLELVRKLIIFTRGHVTEEFCRIYSETIKTIKTTVN
jgi:hypothetical protein